MTKTADLDELYERYKTKAQAVGTEVYRFGTRYEALESLIPLLKKEGVADSAGAFAVCAAGPAIRSWEGAELSTIPGVHFEVTRELAAEALIGITEVDFALADTGTLVQDQSAVEQRLASSLPTIHIAILGTNTILPDKGALITRINPRKSRFIAFITGPSRTADIERVLTIGVHGPKRLIVLAVDESEGETL
ncbi:lactate utilization protein [Geomonas sp. RF6]|uniref:LutC/YkgG family protein n=1 Tax=Geomonas sp. RF6 TaxID=2897342 RepID=UPI001E377AF0|nr:lactate utilization protein [Geomonas sp. RF6]UFS70279.1 lactate utilization protein [Geomonas sp. RF6]